MKIIFEKYIMEIILKNIFYGINFGKNILTNIFGPIRGVVT